MPLIVRGHAPRQRPNVQVADGDRRASAAPRASAEPSRPTRDSTPPRPPGICPAPAPDRPTTPAPALPSLPRSPRRTPPRQHPHTRPLRPSHRRRATGRRGFGYAAGGLGTGEERHGRGHAAHAPGTPGTPGPGGRIPRPGRIRRCRPACSAVRPGLPTQDRGWCEGHAGAEVRSVWDATGFHSEKAYRSAPPDSAYKEPDLR